MTKAKEYNKKGILFILLLSILGAVLGGYQAQKQAESFLAPLSVDATRWNFADTGINVISNSHSDGVGAYIQDAALHIQPYKKLIPNIKQKVFDLEIQLTSSSDPIHLTLHNNNRSFSLDLGTEAFYPKEQRTWISCACNGLYRIFNKNNEIWMQYGTAQEKIFFGNFSSFSLSAPKGRVSLTHLRALDQNYTPIFKASYTQRDIPTLTLLIGGLMGGFLGLIGGLLLYKQFSLFALAIYWVPILILPYIVTSLSASQWETWIQKLYLSKSKTWELAQYMLYASLVPALIVFVGTLGLGIHTSKPQPNPKKYLVGWLLGIFLTLGISSWGAPIDAATLLAKSIYLLLPGWLIFRASIPTKQFLMREIPVSLMLIFGGWGIGLFAATLWRIIIWASSIPLFRNHHGSRAIEMMMLHLLILPLALEVQIRNTYLKTAWDVKTLSAKYSSKDPSEYLVSMYDKTCGESTSTQRARVVYVGGSSTGGVFQFRKTPDLFFAGQVHAKLCAQKSPQQWINTKNYGRAAMDTHVIAHSFDELLHSTKADLVVMYVGNNDLLTRKSTLSKKQMYMRSEHWKSQLSGIKYYTTQIRLIIGTSLLFRRLDQLSDMVVAVPLEDARENFEIIADVAQKHGTKILLLTEYINPAVIKPVGTNSDEIDIQTQFDAYAKLQAEMAQKYSHIEYVDVWKLMEPYAHEELCIDANHLSELGNRRIAQIALPYIQAMLAQ